MNQFSFLLFISVTCSEYLNFFFLFFSIDIKSSFKYSPASYQSDNYLIRPVSVEPTWDGVAAVVTTLVILPGDRNTPVRISLATSLVSIKSSHQLLNGYDTISVNMIFRTATKRH